MAEEVKIQKQEAILKSTEELKQEADRITKRRTLYAAGAGLLPFPVIDAAILLGIQITMIRSISQLYNVEFKENLVKSIIGSLVALAIGGLFAWYNIRSVTGPVARTVAFTRAFGAGDLSQRLSDDLGSRIKHHEIRVDHPRCAAQKELTRHFL